MANYKVVKLHLDSTSSDIESVKGYISNRYPYLLDYAKFHSSRAGIPELATDLLNDVLLQVLQKDGELLDKLYSIKKGQYREIDFYVLNLIKINAHSPLAPFRWKYRAGNIDTGVNIQRLRIIDEQQDDEVDMSELLLKEYRLVLWIFKGLDLTEFERAVFEFKFIHDELFTQWPGPENYKKVYSTYRETLDIIHNVLFVYGFTKVAPKRAITVRQAEIADRYVKKHKVIKYKQ